MTEQLEVAQQAMEAERSQSHALRRQLDSCEAAVQSQREELQALRTELAAVKEGSQEHLRQREEANDSCLQAQQLALTKEQVGFFAASLLLRINPRPMCGRG